MNKRDLTSFVAMAQGLFYLVTGIWPLVSRRSFEAVTGPKYDFWLVQTIGLLIAVIGGVLGAAGLRGRPSGEVAALGIGSAASLAGADIVFTGKGRIRRVYLLDALAEIGLILLWGLGGRSRVR
jgi:hypothetical protein